MLNVSSGKATRPARPGEDVSLNVRRGEAEATVFYMITGLIPSQTRA